jgi:uncharacterized protein (TIGR03435 family)
MMITLRGHLHAKAISMASLADFLAGQLGLRVVDQTGLKSNYDFDLYYVLDEGQPTLPAGVPPTLPSPGAGGSVGGDGRVPSAANPDADGVPLFTAVQSQLGLKLETKKGPVELIVVDHIEKTPTAN